MRVNNYYKYFSFFLVILSVLSYFLGFLFEENSAGGGTEDFPNVWLNLQTFLNNSIINAVHLTTTSDPDIFFSSFNSS